MHFLVIPFVLLLLTPYVGQSMKCGLETVAPVPDPDTLPVIIHVIHTGTPVGDPDNPSDGAIQDMITLMNNAFQKDGPLYGGADLGLAFRLATRSPECTTSSGIHRIDGSSVNHYVTGGITTDTVFFPNSAHEFFIKSLEDWPNTDYLNIWIVNMIDGDPNGLEGFAFYPQYNTAWQDGVVIRASAVNSSNKTIIHELGHYFNLAHTFGYAWGACEAEGDCMTEGDNVCDTEPCMYTYDCTLPVNPCSGEDWIIVDPEFDYTVLNNYMGYTDCQWMFTEGQKTRMLEALEQFRPGLLHSGGLEMVAGQIPVTACAPEALHGLSPFYGIERVVFGDLNVYSNTSAADNQFYVDHTCNQQAVVHAGDMITTSITVSYENYAHLRVYLDFNGNGEFEVPDELILSGDGGSLSEEVLIPMTAMLCYPLRLRAVVDHPAAPEPTACLLTGTPEDGVGQIEDYTVIIRPRQIESIGSGDWDNPAIWSCACVPTANDALIIRSGDVITVPLSLGTVFCASMQIETGAELYSIADIHVAGGCE